MTRAFAFLLAAAFTAATLFLIGVGGQATVHVPARYGDSHATQVATHDWEVFVAQKSAELAAFYTSLAPKVRTASTRPRVARAVVSGSGDIWWRLALCESGGNPRAVSRTGKFRGAFQFDLDSYRRAGGSGDPIDDSYETQKVHAIRWQQLVGWGAWPVCSRRIGAR